MSARKFWIKMNILYERFMLLVFTAVLLIIIYTLYDSWYIYDKANIDLMKYKPAEGSSVPADAPITDDMVAWITMDDTNIDYPIMQGDNNLEYLNMNPYGEYSLSGSIFLDSRNKPDFSEQYLIIYGHHMEYGAMFGALDEYLDSVYLKAHSDGELLVGRENIKKYRLKVFAGAKINIFKDEVFFDPGIKEPEKLIKEYAAVYDQTVERSEHIIVLSTCIEPVSQNRLLVFCYIYE